MEEKKISLIFLGQTQVGKTTLLFRMTNTELPTSINATIGVDFSSRIVSRDGCPYKVLIWDTAGQEAYAKIARTFLKKADGVFFVYDVTSRDSLFRVDQWIKDLNEAVEGQVPSILIGNKTDKPNRAISKEEAREFAREKGFNYFECSGLLNNGDIEDAFNTMIDKIYPKIKNQNQPAGPKPIEGPPKKSSC